MKYLLSTFVLLFISNNAMTIDKSGNYAVWGIGMKSCFTFNSITVNYLNQDETIQEKDEDWISKLKFWEKKRRKGRHPGGGGHAIQPRLRSPNDVFVFDKKTGKRI